VDDGPEPAIALILHGEITQAYGLIRRTFTHIEQEDAERLIYEVSLLISEVSNEQRRFKAPKSLT
jgi:hypothetical protein